MKKSTLSLIGTILIIVVVVLLQMSRSSPAGPPATAGTQPAATSQVGSSGVA